MARFKVGVISAASMSAFLESRAGNQTVPVIVEELDLDPHLFGNHFNKIDGAAGALAISIHKTERCALGLTGDTKSPLCAISSRVPAEAIPQKPKKNASETRTVNTFNLFHFFPPFFLLVLVVQPLLDNLRIKSNHPLLDWIHALIQGVMPRRKPICRNL